MKNYKAVMRIEGIRIQKVLTHIKKSIWLYIILLFLVSRVLYTVIGDTSIKLINRHVPPSITSYTSEISPYKPVQMWYNWDASNYGSLAQGYSTSLKTLQPMGEKDGKTGYDLLRWMPLYPITAKIVSDVTSISVPYSQLLISNLAFIIAMYLLYKLVIIDENDKFARTVMAFLVILPTSFIFSAGLSESLFLVLAIGSLYCARKQHWIAAGVIGALLALTRSEGFLISIPLLVEATQQYGFGREKIKAYIKPIIAASTAIAGLLLFMLYCYIRTKNPFAYVDSQYVANGVKFGNPVVYVYHNLLKVRTVIILGEFTFILLAWKKLRWSYIAYAFVVTFMTLAIGHPPAGVGSSLRYMSVVFPLAIAAGYLSQIKSLTNYIWVSFGVLNGMLFILWVNWWIAFII